MPELLDDGAADVSAPRLADALDGARGKRAVRKPRRTNRDAAADADPLEARRGRGPGTLPSLGPLWAAGPALTRFIAATLLLAREHEPARI